MSDFVLYLKFKIRAIFELEYKCRVFTCFRYKLYLLCVLELMRVLRMTGDSLTEEEAEEMIELMGSKRDGLVDINGKNSPTHLPK